MRKKVLNILGIESSCDETASAIVRRQPNGKIEVLSSIISSQTAAHAPYGGVVPEIAARQHIEKIDIIIDQAMQKANIKFSEIDAIAATAGPGLIGGVITGLMAAKGLALSLNVPLLAINHLEGHALSPRLSHDCPYPYLLLLVSGGHSQLLSVNGLGDFKRLGSSIDDAAGEAFDKTAKIMQLGFPGGPALERMAKYGNDQAFDLPRPLIGREGADFSFAGLKTATLRALQKSNNICEQTKADLSASFQRAIADVLVDRSKNAMEIFKQMSSSGQTKKLRFVVAGGVAANQTIRKSLTQLCQEQGFEMIAPPLKYCGDNAAMIALVGVEKLLAGEKGNLSAKARPRWPLDEASAALNPKSGFGKKGAKS